MRAVWEPRWNAKCAAARQAVAKCAELAAALDGSPSWRLSWNRSARSRGICRAAAPPWCRSARAAPETTLMRNHYRRYR